MTPLQAEIRALHIQYGVSVEKALKDCKTEYQRRQCLDAYTKLLRLQEDVVSQRHGLPPALHRAIP